VNAFKKLCRLAALGLLVGALAAGASLGTMYSTVYFAVDDAVPIDYSVQNLGGGRVVRDGLVLTGDALAFGGPGTTQFGLWEDTISWQAMAGRGQARIMEAVRSDTWQLTADRQLTFYADYFIEEALRPGDGEVYDPALHRGAAEFTFRIWWQDGGEPVLLLERERSIGMPAELGIDGPVSFRVERSGLLWWERSAVLDVKAVPESATASLAALALGAIWASRRCARISVR
jgi:hypothetical protein